MQQSLLVAGGVVCWPYTLTYLTYRAVRWALIGLQAGRHVPSERTYTVAEVCTRSWGVPAACLIATELMAS